MNNSKKTTHPRRWWLPKELRDREGEAHLARWRKQWGNLKNFSCRVCGNDSYAPVPVAILPSRNSLRLLWCVELTHPPNHYTCNGCSANFSDPALWSSTDTEPKGPEDLLICKLGLSARSATRLYRMGLETVGELIEKTDEELLEGKNFGKTSLEEVKVKLAELGLKLKGEYY